MKNNEQAKELTDKELKGVSGGIIVDFVLMKPHRDYQRARWMQGLSAKELEAKCIKH